MDTATDTAPIAEIYDPKHFEPRMGIGGLLSRVKMALVDALDAELAQFDISAAQYVILVNLASGCDSSSDLCRSVSYDPGAMTRMLDRLERKGLIRRVRCFEDRRVARLALAAAAGLVLIHLGGLAQLAILTGSGSGAVRLGTLPFLAGDLAKLVIAVLLLWPTMRPVRARL